MPMLFIAQFWKRVGFEEIRMGTAITHGEQDSLASRRLPYLLKPIFAEENVHVMG